MITRLLRIVYLNGWRVFLLHIYFFVVLRYRVFFLMTCTFMYLNISLWLNSNVSEFPKSIRFVSRRSSNIIWLLYNYVSQFFKMCLLKFSLKHLRTALVSYAEVFSENYFLTFKKWLISIWWMLTFLNEVFKEYMTCV